MSEFSLFDEIATGLKEAIAYERGELDAPTVRLTQRFAPVPEWTPEAIKNLRLKSDMTQRMFAEFMGVSIKTVEAWECGRNRPNGPASRLMQVVAQNTSLLSSPTLSR